MWRAGPEAPDEIPQFVYCMFHVVAVCLNESDSVCLNGWAGQGKPSQR